jgi:Ca2+-binding EF-hand superfamily protein
MLKKLDADGDGTVTLEEFLKPKADRFAELDTQGTGSLSGEALVGREKAELDYRIKRMLKRYDADGDERITKEEFEKPARARFAKRDFNGDGKISDDELPPRHKKFSRGDSDNDADDEGKVNGSGDPDKQARRDDGERGYEGRHHRFHHHHRHHHWRHGGKGWHEKSRSLDDVLKRTARRFDQHDANQDGVIDKDEIAGDRSKWIAYKQRRRMHALDANKDGSVSREEFLADRQARFSMLDLTGDGKIAADDLPPRAARFWERKADGKQDQ